MRERSPNMLDAAIEAEGKLRVTQDALLLLKEFCHALQNFALRLALIDGVLLGLFA